MRKTIKNNKGKEIVINRLCELSNGDVFLYSGTIYMIYSKAKNKIFAKPVSHHSSLKSHIILGSNCMWWVEIPDIHKEPETVKEHRHQLAVYTNIASNYLTK